MRKWRSGQRQFYAEASAATRKRIDEEIAAETGDAFVHPKETHAAVAAGIKADAVIFNGEEQAAILFLNEDADAGGVSVLDAIVESFLDHTIDAGAVIFGEVIGKLAVDDVDGEAGAFGDLAALPLESGNEAEVVEHGGAKEQGHVTDLVDAFLGEELDALEGGGDGRGGQGSIGETLKINEQSGERLADLVVKFAGDGAALLFLSVDEALGEFLEFVLRAQGLLVFFASVALEMGKIKDGGSGEEQAEGKGEDANDEDAVASLPEDEGDLSFGLTEVEFVDVADFAGQSKQGGALGEGEVAQGDSVFFSGIDDEDAVGQEPVGREFIAEFLKRGILVAGERAQTGIESSVGVIAEIVELMEVGVAGGGVGLGQRIFAKEIAGFVEAEANVAKSTLAFEIVLADGGAGHFETIEGVDGVEGQDGHENEEGAEAKDHGGAGTDATAGARDGSGEGLRLFEMG